jgi:hypothetical protein
LAIKPVEEEDSKDAEPDHFTFSKNHIQEEIEKSYANTPENINSRTDNSINFSSHPSPFNYERQNSALNISYTAGHRDLRQIFRNAVQTLTKFKHIKSQFKEKRGSLTLQDNTVIYSAT